MVLTFSFFSRSPGRQLLVREASRIPTVLSQCEPAVCYQRRRREYPILPTFQLTLQQRRWSGNQALQLPKSRAQPSMRMQAGDKSDMLRDIGLLPGQGVQSEGNCDFVIRNCKPKEIMLMKVGARLIGQIPLYPYPRKTCHLYSKSRE